MRKQTAEERRLLREHFKHLSAPEPKLEPLPAAIKRVMKDPRYKRILPCVPITNEELDRMQ